MEHPGHAQWRRSLAPDAPALEPEEAALVVAPLSAEPAESVTVTGFGEIDMAAASAIDATRGSSPVAKGSPVGQLVVGD